MIPHFQPPVYAEMIRDGGSLAFGFTANENRFWLFFPIVFDDMGRRSGYGHPVVVNRTLNVEEPITWHEAFTWLRDGLDHLGKQADKKWAEAMIETCNRKGGLPSAVEP